MSVAENKALIEKLYAELPPDSLEQLDKYYAAEYVNHGAWHDLDGLKKTFAAFQAASPDLRLVIKELIAEGDKVVARAAAVGTREGETRTINYISIYRIADGKITEEWSHSDSFF